MSWITVIAAFIVVGYLLDREIYFYEGVHLGPRAQAWLYDRWSRKYDEGKRASQLRDAELLARPLLDLLKDVPEPFVLDFATGTGRLSYALLSEPEFKGQIIALDLSQGMLEQAAAKVKGRGDPAPTGADIEFLRHVALPLPFADAAFDVVCCLEVLELFPNMDTPLAELTRVLRPGGVLLSTRGTEESGRKAKVKSRAEMVGMLENNNFLSIEISPWWKLFERVIAIKDGDPEPSPARGLEDIYQCPACKHTEWKKSPDALKCGHCGKALTITSEGIVLG